MRKRSLYPFSYHFFFSYTTRESEIKEIAPVIQRLGMLLRQNGFASPAFVDNLVLAQKERERRELIDNLDQGLDESICMIALISPGYLNSKWCKFEWREMHRQSQKSNYPLILPIVWKSVDTMWNSSGEIPGLYPTINVCGGARQLERADELKTLVTNAAFFILGCTGIRAESQLERAIHPNPRIVVYRDPYDEGEALNPGCEVMLNHAALHLLGLECHEHHMTCESLEMAVRKHGDLIWTELQQAISDARAGRGSTRVPTIEGSDKTQRFHLMVASTSIREVPVLKPGGKERETEWVVGPPLETIEIVACPCG